jgi:hypothetical protein
MKAKHALWLLGAIFSISILTFLLFRDTASARAEAVPGASNASAAVAGSHAKVIAYYFHVTVRCQTCRTIEAYSKEAIDKGFAGDLKNGAIEWRLVNVQLPENRHFIQDYRLFTRSLVLVKVRDGKQVEWRNLEKVWDLVGDKADFVKYVQTNVKDYL